MTKSEETSYQEALLLLDLPAESIGGGGDDASTVTVVEEGAYPTEYPKKEIDQETVIDLVGALDQENIDDSVFLAAALLGQFQQHASKNHHEDLFPSNPKNKNKAGKQVKEDAKKVKRSNYQKVYAGGIRECDYCQATVTPMWRHGPPGYEDLCNKCGVKWKRGKLDLSNPAVI